MPEEVVIGGQTFSTECPGACPGRSESFGQGGLCARCPLFNCKPTDDGFRLLEPNDYRPDWAKAWKEWFNSGMQGYPELPLERE